jgi:hypothetical protein
MKKERMKPWEDKSMKTKCLAIGIILLFIGVAVAPSINQSIVTASQEDDLVEVTTQACGIQGYGDTTVKLTREQYQDLGQYLVEFRARLNQTTTREDAVPIFKEAVVELDKYGLLPKGMSVERIQRWVTSRNQIQKVPNIIKKSVSECINFFCLFAAITYDVVDYNLWVITAGLLSQFIHYDSPFILLVYLFFFIGFVKPLRFFNFLTVDGGGHFNFHFSIGLKGISTGLEDISDVIGFTGLKIWFNSHNAFYLGFALLVK